MPRVKRPAVRLVPPTTTQLQCVHDWEVRHSRRHAASGSPWPRTRYVRCVRCGLHVRTLEKLEVPWAIEERR
jgi:hypothetical protein